jgi:hypothetical protein
MGQYDGEKCMVCTQFFQFQLKIFIDVIHVAYLSLKTVSRSHKRDKLNYVLFLNINMIRCNKKKEMSFL